MRLGISACYLIKNEEEFLEQSLLSVVDHVEELIILDSGSSDKSVAIAQSFRPKVSKFTLKDFSWNDDFADARNYAASLASSDWVLFIDGDEVVDSSGWPLMATALQNPSSSCFSVIQRNYSRNPGLENATRANPDPLKHQDLYAFENWMERLYKPSTGLRYEGRIHETLLLACERLHLKSSRLPVILHHYGRLKKNASEKPNYYLRLSLKKLEEFPELPAAWIEAVVALLEVQDTQRAFETAEKGADRFPQMLEVTRVYAQASLRNGEFEKAESALRKLPGNDEWASSQLTTALLYQKKLEATLHQCQKVLAKNPQDFVAHLNAAVVYFENQDWTNAARHLSSAHELRPEDSFVNEALKKIPAPFQMH